MRVPRSVLPHRITVAAYQGDTGATGASFGTPSRPEPAMLQGKRKMVRVAPGKVTMGNAVAIVGPSVVVEAEAQVTVTKGPWLGKTFRVLEVGSGEGLYGTVLQELVLEGPR